jgi:hypothetical protein
LCCCWFKDTDDDDDTDLIEVSFEHNQQSMTTSA